MAMYIVKPWYRKKDDAIYGAEWAGTSSPAWTRTDDAVGFSAPNPYYSGMSTTPSSPFDNIMPWSGMRKVYNADAGWLVEIPKYYYKWTRNVNNKMKVQISMTKHDGYFCSPAHADRGDGVGERDYVYVGRYHCSTNDYKSTSGVRPKASMTRATARTGIHNLGTNIWQNDFSMFWTIAMLYLVEFANWNSQEMIGYGCGNGSSTENSGASDTMPYHTGTIKTSRTTWGTGIQYRYIENLWANVREWVDGLYCNNRNIFCIKNPTDFSDSSNGTNVGTTTSESYSTIIKWSNPSASGFEFALCPSQLYGSITTSYCSDVGYYGQNGVVLFTGGGWADRNIYYGMFFFNASAGATHKDTDIGSRLMVLPPSRLSA